jgi:hypothetical protein
LSGGGTLPSYVTVVLKWRDVWGLRRCVTYYMAELWRSAMLRPVSRTDGEECGSGRHGDGDDDTAVLAWWKKLLHSQFTS